MSRESHLKSATPIGSPPDLDDKGFEFQDSQDQGLLRKASTVKKERELISSIMHDNIFNPLYNHPCLRKMAIIF